MFENSDASAAILLKEESKMAEKKTVGAAKKYVLPGGLMRLHIQLEM
jgi:hypothetical protein